MCHLYCINWKYLWKYISILTLLSVYLNVFAQPGWYSVSGGYEYGHHAVYFVSPDTGWVAMEIGYVSKTTDGGKEWVTQYTGSNYHPSDLFFLNSSIGWMTTDALQILKTQDGGISWKKVFEGGGYYNALYSVYFVDEQIGWAVGRKFISTGTGSDSTVIIKTTNGGTNWNYQTAGTQDFQLSSVFFLMKMWDG
jgi:photosystem II stability/assembly factor-like uncharacterized protein